MIGCNHYKKENTLSNCGISLLNDTSWQNTLSYSPCFCNGMTQPDKENTVSSEDKNTFDAFINKQEDKKQEIKSGNNKLEKEIPEFLKPFYNNIWNNKTAKQAFLLAVSPIIFLRRIMSVPDKIRNGDYLGALGMIITMGILSPEDFRDMNNAVKQITGKQREFYDYKDYQKPFSFIRNTLIQPVVNKMGKWGYYLHEHDRSLYHTRIGQKIKNWFGVKDDRIYFEEKIPRIFKDEITGEYIKDTYMPIAVKLEGGSKIGRLICRANERMTLIGVELLYLFSIPSIIKAFNRGENTRDKITNGGKQALKAAVGVTASVLSIGLVGALMASSFGFSGSVIGMGLGAFIGYNLADMINRNIKTK